MAVLFIIVLFRYSCKTGIIISIKSIWSARGKGRGSTCVRWTDNIIIKIIFVWVLNGKIWTGFIIIDFIFRIFKAMFWILAKRKMAVLFIIVLFRYSCKTGIIISIKSIWSARGKGRGSTCVRWTDNIIIKIIFVWVLNGKIWTGFIIINFIFRILDSLKRTKYFPTIVIFFVVFIMNHI